MVVCRVVCGYRVIVIVRSVVVVGAIIVCVIGCIIVICGIVSITRIRTKNMRTRTT